MAEIKAIPTRYKGYHFRSRLEARWAVFFDALGIKWEYEPEGFQLDNGDKYLPDFYFPEFNIYAEIKPSSKSDHKCDAFFNSTGHPIVLLSGIPISESPYKLWCFFSDHAGGGFEIVDVIFSNYPEEIEEECNTEYTLKEYRKIAPYKFMALNFDYEYSIYELGNVDDDGIVSIDIRVPCNTFAYNDMPNPRRGDSIDELTRIYENRYILQKYADFARSARFEHGENGAT